MSRKRIIFGLIWDRGSFCLSRNFRRQRVGNLDWLLNNYGFENLSRHVDELVLVDASPDGLSGDEFLRDLKIIGEHVFSPLIAGGNLSTVERALEYFDCGADKVLVNGAQYGNPDLVRTLAKRFGAQAVISCVDYRITNEALQVYCSNGSEQKAVEDLRPLFDEGNVGEVLLQSIEADGTGNGVDLRGVNLFPWHLEVPILVAGGAGKAIHLEQALAAPAVSGIVTANILNFVGDGLATARQRVIEASIDIGHWGSWDDLAGR